MIFVADVLLAFGSITAAFYCFVLSRRLSKFSNLENGMGGAVAVLSAQVDDLNIALAAAQKSASASASTLTDLTQRAEVASGRLELLVASVHDVLDREDQKEAEPTPNAPTPEPIFMRHGRSIGSALS